MILFGQLRISSKVVFGLIFSEILFGLTCFTVGLYSTTIDLTVAADYYEFGPFLINVVIAGIVFILTVAISGKIAVYKVLIQSILKGKLYKADKFRGEVYREAQEIAFREIERAEGIRDRMVEYKAQFRQVAEDSFNKLESILSSKSFFEALQDREQLEDKFLEIRSSVNKLDTVSPEVSQIAYVLIDTMKAIVDKYSDKIVENHASVQNKNLADEFAIKMYPKRLEAEHEGYGSTRKMAEYFNSKGWASFRGKRFNHSSISDLIKRQDELKSEGQLTLGSIPPSNE